MASVKAKNFKISVENSFLVAVQWGIMCTAICGIVQ